MRYNLRSVVAVMLAGAPAAWAVESRVAAPNLVGDARGGEIDPGPVDGALFGELPNDCVVHAVGTYRGTVNVEGVALDRSGHQVMRADVVVNVPDRPVVLVLTAYDPTVWRVGRTAKTRLVGVVVSGYHGQALVGIDKQTPHAVSTCEKRGRFEYFYANGASPRLLAMNDAVRRLVGRGVDRFENKPAGDAFHVGERPKDAAEVIYSDDLKVADFADAPRVAAPGQPAPLPAGDKGIDRLVLDGKLRPATPADIGAWVDRASEPYKRFNPDLRVSSEMRVGRTYVVLGAVALPDGMFGAHRRDFIIPDGVAFPTGPRGHNGFYRTDGTQEGPQAPRE